MDISLRNVDNRISTTFPIKILGLPDDEVGRVDKNNKNYIVDNIEYLIRDNITGLSILFINGYLYYLLLSITPIIYRIIYLFFTILTIST